MNKIKLKDFKSLYILKKKVDLNEEAIILKLQSNLWSHRSEFALGEDNWGENSLI